MPPLGLTIYYQNSKTDLSYGSWKWWQSLFFLQCQGSKKAKKSSAQEPDIPAALTRILTKRPATYLPYEETRPAEYSNREQYLFYGHSSSSTSFIHQDIWPISNLFISPLQLQLDFCILFLINIYLVNTAALHISDCSAQTAQDVVN